MPIKINGATSGSTTITAPDTGSDESIELSTALASKGDYTDWTTWTPSYTNLSGGTTNVAVYAQIGKIVYCKWMYTLGGAGISGAVTLSAPVAPSSRGVNSPLGSSTLVSSGVDRWLGTVVYSGSNFEITYLLNDTNGIKQRSINATLPFTWGASDVLHAQWTYEAA